MADIKSFPNNQDEYIGAEPVMKWLHGRTSGVFAASGNAAVSALIPPEMAVTVSDGVGWIANSNMDGIVWWNDNEKNSGAKLQLTIDPADGVLNRIDRIVVEWKTTNYVEYPEIKVLKGSIASTAIVPSLSNNSTVRQISLARINIPAGTTEISAGNITDERLDPTVCGLVTEAVTADTSVINAQFEELLEHLLNAISQAGDQQIIDGAVTTEKIADGAVTENKIMSGAVTKAKLGADVTAATLGGVSISKLWVNASPDSDFPAQEIALSLMAENKVLIKLSQGKETPYTGKSYQLCDFTTDQLQTQALHLLLENASPMWAYRPISISESKISFGGGAYKGVDGKGNSLDNYCIPLEIYAVKGVT